MVKINMTPSQQRDKQSGMDSGTVAQLEMSGIIAGIACLGHQLC